MKICPNCGAEYKNSVTVCADCDVELISKEKMNEIQKKYKDWEEVFSSPQLYEAEMVKTNLESAGIECMILDKKDSSFPLGGELGEIKVMVPKYRVEEALLIIEKLEKEFEENEDEE